MRKLLKIAKESPEYKFDVTIQSDELQMLIVKLRIEKKKSIQAPTETPKPVARRRTPPIRQSTRSQQMIVQTNEPLEVQQLLEPNFDD